MPVYFGKPVSPNIRTASTNAGPSSACTLAFTVSGVSPASSARLRCTTMGPPSTAAVTMCTVQPVSVSPASRTALCTSRSMPPANFGSRLGCTLMHAPAQSLQNSGLTIRMKPTSITRSTPYSRNTSVNLASYSARGVPFLQGTWTAGMPSFLARSRMPASDLLEQATTTWALRVPALMASMVACELLPRVEPTIATRVGRSMALRPMSLRQ
mmetsp:Transcript_51726/g.149138  ORF Transcript_51726/g.149138 Transcript_51726/m.149138 type:complete len:212 (-) Transcript_51726:2370-3005(-)